MKTPGLECQALPLLTSKLATMQPRLVERVIAEQVKAAELIGYSEDWLGVERAITEQIKVVKLVGYSEDWTVIATISTFTSNSEAITFNFAEWQNRILYPWPQYLPILGSKLWSLHFAALPMPGVNNCKCWFDWGIIGFEKVFGIIVIGTANTAALDTTTGIAATVITDSTATAITGRGTAAVVNCSEQYWRDCCQGSVLSCRGCSCCRRFSLRSSNTPWFRSKFRWGIRL